MGILKRKSGGGVPIGHFSVDYFFGIMRAHSSHVLMKVCRYHSFGVLGKSGRVALLNIMEFL